MVSLLTLNIGAAAQPRAHRLLDWLSRRDEEVVVLSETSAGPGTALLLDRFAGAGWEVAHTPDPSGERGVAVLSRIAAVQETRSEFAGVSVPGRVAYTLLDTRPRVGVLGLYVPNTKIGDKKRQFITSLLRAVYALPADQRAHLVVAGDYNVISRDHQPRHPGFAAYEYGLLEHLEELGVTDAHVRLHPGEQVHSWVGRTGEGYRYDYCHVGSGLSDRVTTSAYTHTPRQELGLTDHSAVALSLSLDSVRLLECGDPTEDGAPTLF